MGGGGDPAHVHESLSERHTLTVRIHTPDVTHVHSGAAAHSMRGSQCAMQLSVTLSRPDSVKQDADRSAAIWKR